MCETDSDFSVDSSDKLFILIGDVIVPKGKGHTFPSPHLRYTQGLLNPIVTPSYCFCAYILKAEHKNQIAEECRMQFDSVGNSNFAVDLSNRQELLGLSK